MEARPSLIMIRKALTAMLALVVLTSASGCRPSTASGSAASIPTDSPVTAAPAAASGSPTATAVLSSQDTKQAAQSEAPRPTVTSRSKPAPTALDLPTQTGPVVNPVPTSGTCVSPENWEDMPVIPDYVSERAVAIYQEGLARGNLPNVFSVVGDCQNVPEVFFGIFDHPDDYTLGDENAYLKPVIAYFAGSFDRTGLARKGGLNAAAVLSPFRADPDKCRADENSLQCELRINHPSIVIVSLEEWWSKQPVDIYEGYLRKVLDQVIASGAVPILVTKADNLEGHNDINQTLVKLACEYQIPLWNFWKAVQPLPNHGLWKDGFHLSVGLNNFGDPLAMRNARPMRNLTGLQTLDRVWRGLNRMEMSGP